MMKKNHPNPISRGRCWKGVLLCLAPFAAVSTADAQIIAEESFEYTVGNTLGGDSLDGGQGWGTAGTNTSSAWSINSLREDGTVSSGSLSYSDGTNSLVTGGNAVTGSPAGDPVDVQRNLDTNITSGDFWFSALMRTDNTATVNTLIFSDDKISGDPGIVATLGSDISIGGAGGTSSTGGTPLATASANTTYFVVGNYRKASGGTNDEFELWVNPDLGGASPANAAGSATATITAAEIVNNNNPLNNVRWRVTGDTSGNADLDEIRVGRTFGDVSPIPEPGTFALLAGLSGLAMVMLRRRR